MLLKIRLRSFISLNTVRIFAFLRGLSCPTLSFYRRLLGCRNLYFYWVNIHGMIYSITKPCSEHFINTNSWFIIAHRYFRWEILYNLSQVLLLLNEGIEALGSFVSLPWCSTSSPKSACMGTWRDYTPCISPERFVEVCIPTCRQTARTPPETSQFFLEG